MDVIIYILCYDEITLQQASLNYPYTWAKPIILEDQDYTFENVFWDQLTKIDNEWINCKMVGCLSHIAYTKINITIVDIIIRNKLYNKYHHFYKLNDKYVLDTNSNALLYHPKFDIMWNDFLKKTELKDCHEYGCNYFMCSPVLMKNFIEWYSQILPFLKNHPLAFINSKYRGHISKGKLISLTGRGYYPLLPFILERGIPCYFENQTFQTIDRDIKGMCSGAIQGIAQPWTSQARPFPLLTRKQDN